MGVTKPSVIGQGDHLRRKAEEIPTSMATLTDAN